MPATLGLVSRVALAIGENAEGLEEIPAAPGGPIYHSDTGELTWSVESAGQGVLAIDTARTKALIGFTDHRTFDLGGVVIETGLTGQGWSTIATSTFDGETLTGPGSARGILVATGDHENTRQIWKDENPNSVGRNWGIAPALVEVIRAAITLPVAPSRLLVWALDQDGNRMAEVPVEDADGKARFRIGESGPTLWYEICVVEDPQAGNQAAQKLNEAASGRVKIHALLPCRRTRRRGGEFSL